MVVKIDYRHLLNEFKDSLANMGKATEDAFTQLKEKSCPSPEFTGWYDWPKNQGFALCERIKKFTAEYKTPFDTVVVIGIGGSYLGTRAIHEVISHAHQDFLSAKGIKQNVKPIVYAGNDLSESQMIDLLERLDNCSPVVNIISKSGTTTEPSVAFRVIQTYLEKRYGNVEAEKRIIATTDANKGALLQVAKEKNFPLFEVPDDVGGRFSVLTAVGLLPLCLAGADIESLMQGASDFFEEMSSEPIGTGNNEIKSLHPSLQYAAIRKVAHDAGKRVELLCYHEPKLLYFIEWFKQLFGESEGKDGKGMLPCGMLLSTDLHSLGQYAQDGSPIQLETFLTVEEPTQTGELKSQNLSVPKGNPIDGVSYLENVRFSEINKKAQFATLLAHVDASRPVTQLSVPDLSMKTLGYLVAFFETTCAVSGILLGVNPFDQPGVEAYKKNLFAIMGRPGYEDLAAELSKRM